MSYWIRISLPTPDTLGGSKLPGVLPAKVSSALRFPSRVAIPCIPVNCCTTYEQLVVPVAKCVMCVYSETEVPYFFNQTPRLLFCLWTVQVKSKPYVTWLKLKLRFTVMERLRLLKSVFFIYKCILLQCILLTSVYMYITTPTLIGTDSMNIWIFLEPLAFVVCFSTTTTQGRLLFEGGVCFIGKLGDNDDRRISLLCLVFYVCIGSSFLYLTCEFNFIFS